MAATTRGEIDTQDLKNLLELEYYEDMVVGPDWIAANHLEVLDDWDRSDPEAGPNSHFKNDGSGTGSGPPPGTTVDGSNPILTEDDEKLIDSNIERETKVDRVDRQ